VAKVITLLTFWAVKNLKTAKIHEGISDTKVYVKKVGESELTGYVNDHDVTTFVGGYEPTKLKHYNLLAASMVQLIIFSIHLPFEDILPLLQKEKV
jgi:predicted house-cleaning NTP pyrophosphatase (Maf/HAM1 superfamily)